MSWFREANNNDIFKKIKKILKEHMFTQKLLSDYNIPIEEIDTHLELEIKELDGRFAEGNEKRISLDPKLFKGNNFFKKNFHFVIHELFHWVKRRSEAKFYFNDSEEVQSFVLAVAWEILMNKTDDEIFSTIYPIVEAHFENKENSQKVFIDMVNKAKKLLEVYEDNK